jgi:hypothetical protein
VCAREPGQSVRYARVVHGQNAGTVTVTLDDAGAATVEYDLTALSDEAAANLARFAAQYSQYLQHWEQAIAEATSNPPA